MRGIKIAKRFAPDPFIAKGHPPPSPCPAPNVSFFRRVFLSRFLVSIRKNNNNNNNTQYISQRCLTLLLHIISSCLSHSPDNIDNMGGGGEWFYVPKVSFRTSLLLFFIMNGVVGCLSITRLAATCGTCKKNLSNIILSISIILFIV